MTAVDEREERGGNAAKSEKAQSSTSQAFKMLCCSVYVPVVLDLIVEVEVQLQLVAVVRSLDAELDPHAAQASQSTHSTSWCLLPSSRS